MPGIDEVAAAVAIGSALSNVIGSFITGKSNADITLKQLDQNRDQFREQIKLEAERLQVSRERLQADLDQFEESLKQRKTEFAQTLAFKLLEPERAQKRKTRNIISAFTGFLNRRGAGISTGEPSNIISRPKAPTNVIASPAPTPTPTQAPAQQGFEVQGQPPIPPEGFRDRPSIIRGDEMGSPTDPTIPQVIRGGR